MGRRRRDGQCGKWVKADPSKHGSQRIVCTLKWGHSAAWHQNGFSGWGWAGYDERRVPARDWRCNGWVDELKGACGRVFRGSEDEARVRGWKIGYRLGMRDPLCPQCGRPDPVTAALARDLERSVGRG
jgi:hypothetical protein